MPPRKTEAVETVWRVLLQDQLQSVTMALDKRNDRHTPFMKGLTGRTGLAEPVSLAFLTIRLPLNPLPVELAEPGRDSVRRSAERLLASEPGSPLFK